MFGDIWKQNMDIEDDDDDNNYPDEIKHYEHYKLSTTVGPICKKIIKQQKQILAAKSFVPGL